jgi:hypothetical protein
VGQRAAENLNGRRDLNGEFKSSDLVSVFTAGKYERVTRPHGRKETLTVTSCSAVEISSRPSKVPAPPSTRFPNQRASCSGWSGYFALSKRFVNQPLVHLSYSAYDSSMAYEIFIHEIAEEELRQLRTFDRVRVLDEIAVQLMHQPTLANRRRKCLEKLESQL